MQTGFPVFLSGQRQVPRAAAPGLGFGDPVGQSAGLWTPVFGDDFTGTSVTVVDAPSGLVQLSPGGPLWQGWYYKWPSFVAQSPGGAHTNTNDASYYALSQLSVASSVLTLSSVHSATGGLPYTSGMICSLLDNGGGFSQQFGYFEARIRVNSADTTLWPAFWMLNAGYVNSSTKCELDIFERNPAVSTSTTLFNAITNTGSDDSHQISPNVDMTQWHVYGASWNAGGATGYLDGVQVATSTNSMPDPMCLMADLAAYAPSTPAFANATMDVDYIRAWK